MSCVAYVDSDKFIIVNDSVQNRDQSKFVLTVTPYTISDGYVTFELLSKSFEGDIDFFLGFDSEFLKPTEALYYKPEDVINSYTVPDGLYYNYTLSPKHLYVYDKATPDSEYYLVFSHHFDSYNLATKTIFWMDIAYSWQNINALIDVNYKDYLDMNVWYSYKNFSIEKDVTYKLKVFMELQQIKLGVKDFKKYVVAFKPSNETLDEAINNGHFYFLDPWYDSNWGYRKSHTINNATGAGTNYQISVTTHYGSGSDSGDDVYLNSNCQTDFDDVRFTDNDGETLLDYWLEEKTDSDQAIFWVEIADDLGSNVDIYVYYGNDVAVSASDFTTTFIEGDTFTRSDSDTVGATEILSNTWTERTQGGSVDFDIVSNQLKTMVEDFTVGTCTIPFSQYNLAMDFMINVPSDVTTNWGGAHIRKSAESHIFTTSGLLILFRETGVINVAGGSPSGDTAGTFTAGTDQKISIRAYNDDIKVYVEGVKELDFDESTEAGGYVDLAYYEVLNVIWDTFRVRKYVDPEPSHGIWGSEEEYTVPIGITEYIVPTQTYAPVFSPFLFIVLAVCVSVIGSFILFIIVKNR